MVDRESYICENVGRAVRCWLYFCDACSVRMNHSDNARRVGWLTLRGESINRRVNSITNPNTEHNKEQTVLPAQQNDHPYLHLPISGLVEYLSNPATNKRAKHHSETLYRHKPRTSRPLPVKLRSRSLLSTQLRDILRGSRTKLEHGDARAHATSALHLHCRD